MKSYNAVGFAILAACLTSFALLAPGSWGSWLGMAVGILYILFVWFLAGLYLSDVIHMGITHQALDYKPWFIKTLVLLNNTVGIYVNPVSWVNRHRNHHRFADHAGDPNKLSADGFWKTTYLCMFPYRCKQDMARDEVLKTWPFTMVAFPAFAVFAQFVSYAFVWVLVRDWRYAFALWAGIRVFALWVNLIQNYWTHDRRFGTRRYDDPGDNAMNIDQWLPVMATFSACLQNNHHHHPHLLRLSHSDTEFDFGFTTVKAMAALGLVKSSRTGNVRPPDLSRLELGL